MHDLPTLNGTLLTDLAAALITVLICMAGGSTVGGKSSRWPGADMLVGVGMFIAFVAVLATTLRIPLSWLFAAFAALALIDFALRRRVPGGGTWLALLLLAPVLLRAAGSSAALWDEVWHWLPNAAYAYINDSLAWPDLPPSFSRFHGYPQLIPLLIAQASFIAGRFLESAGPVINVALLAGASALLADALAAVRAGQGRLAAATTPVGLTAAAVVLTVLLNPGLDGGILLSSYADTATMVAIGALGLTGIELLARLAGDDAARIRELSWRFGLIAVVLVTLKQANPVLLLLLLGGLALVAWRDPAIPVRGAIRQLPRMLVPAVVVFLLWRWYVAGFLVNAEMAFRSLHAWNFDVAGKMLLAFGKIIAGRPLFHGMMWLVTVAGLVAFLDLPRKSSEARRLAVVCAFVWLGYNLFLASVALGAMSKIEAINGADYWRYTPHVALLGLYVPVLAAARWSAWDRLRGRVPAAILSLLALSALPLRADLNSPRDRAWPRFIRATVSEMAQTVPPGSRVIIVPCWNESPFAVIVRYQFWQLGAPGRTIEATILWDLDDLVKVAGWAAQGKADYLVMQDAECATDKSAAVLGVAPLRSEFGLFQWREAAWVRVKSWPIPSRFMRPH